MHAKWTQAALYAGAGAGIILFILFGLLPGSFLGGAIGLTVAGTIFGRPLSPALLPKIIIVCSMAAGALVFAVSIIFTCALLGKIAGRCAAWFVAGPASPESAHLRPKK